MTADQRARLIWLKLKGYSPRVARHMAHGTLLIHVRCKLTPQRMPLRIYPDGTYCPPWYDARTINQRRKR